MIPCWFVAGAVAHLPHAIAAAQNTLPKNLSANVAVMMVDKNPSLMSSAIPQPLVSSSFDSYLLEVADAVNTTLDLNTLLQRVAEMLKRFIDYDIFAILLLNEKTQELRIRFQVGHPPEVAERIRIKVGQGVTGQAVLRREPVLVNDVTAEENFINTTPGVRSELAVPLIAKNKVIGVLDVEAAQPGAFTEEHKRLLTLFASRIAVGIENARLYTRVSRQARQLTLLTEISRELTSILNVDELLKRIADLVTRIIDYQMFSILLLDKTGSSAAASLLAALQGERAAEARNPSGSRAGRLRRAARTSRCWSPT